MSKIAVVIGLVLLTCGSSYASSISWGGITLSDNNGLAFLNGYSITTTPTSFILNLPNFSQSDFAFFSGEVDVAVTATDTSPDITGVTYIYDGTIDTANGPASVNFVQTASGTAGALGNFTSTPFSGTLTRSAVGHIDLSAALRLDDEGGLAAINRIEFDIIRPVATPEPSSLMMLAAGLALTWRFGRRRTG
jgi:hypothetical protein